MSENKILNLIVDGNWNQFIGNFLPPIITCVWLTFFGIAFLSIFPKAVPDWLYCLAPVFGFGSIAVITSNIGLLTGVGNKFLFLTISLSSFVLIYFRRENLRQGLKSSGFSWVAGMILVLGFGLLPSISISSGQVLTHPSTNHDSFFYAANEKWVAAHPYSSTPKVSSTAVIDSDPPGSMPAYTVRELNIRAGDGLVSAFINTGSNFETSRTWYVVRTSWLWLAFISVLGATQLMGFSMRRAFSTALLVTTSWQVVFQMYNQNAPAIIGLSLVPISFALGLKIRDATDEKKWLIITTVIVFCIYVTTYGELLPFAGVAFVVSAINSWTRFKARLLDLILIACLVVVITPYASYEAMKYVLRVSGVVNSLGEPQYWGRPLLDIGGDLFGLPANVMFRELVTIVLILTIVVGVVQFSLKNHSIGPIVWVTMIVILWTKLGISGAYYSTDRLVQTMLSTILWLGVTGLLSIQSVIHRRTALTYCMAFLLGLTNSFAPLNYLRMMGNLDWRTYSRELEGLVVAAIKNSGDGKNLIIGSNNYVDRLWISIIGFSATSTEYSFLTSDYFRSITKFDDNIPDEFLLTNLKLTGDSGNLLSTASGYNLLSMKGANSAFLSPVYQDQTEGNGDSISGTGVIEFRTVVWGASSNVLLTFKTEGISPEARLFVDGIDRSSTLKNPEFTITLTPGSHAFQITQETNLVGGGWKVKLLDAQALR